MISNFKELLDSAKEQDNPQRLLFLMAKTESRSKSKKQQTGTITPVMCVDKLPEEIESFPALIAEADTVSSEWDVDMTPNVNQGAKILACCFKAFAKKDESIH